ncbi:MAG: hypothetical protein Q7U16_14865 [Agitococcus sp.]|nr:hypothetical protein [Agitococcus sp.]
MMFLKLLGRTLKRLSFIWKVWEYPSKAFRVRVLIFTFAFIALCVSVPIWYYKAYLPYEGYQYPPLSKMNVDSGIWVFIPQKNKYDYLQTSDGRRILLDDWKMYRYRASLLESQGLNPLTRFDPEIHVKIFWFPRPNTKANEIGQLEIEGKIISPYEQQYKEFMRLKDHSDFYGIVKVLLALMLTMLAWEFLVQYITYRQENK